MHVWKQHWNESSFPFNPLLHKEVICLLFSAVTSVMRTQGGTELIGFMLSVWKSGHARIRVPSSFSRPKTHYSKNARSFFGLREDFEEFWFKNSYIWRHYFKFRVGLFAPHPFCCLQWAPIRESGWLDRSKFQLAYDGWIKPGFKNIIEITQQ